jgi:hypothetical protein
VVPITIDRASLGWSTAACSFGDKKKRRSTHRMVNELLAERLSVLARGNVVG